MVLTVSFVLSPVSRAFVTVPGVKRQLHRRVNASIGASGPHDFTVSFFAPPKRPPHPAQRS
jgi:hypothetical protein